MAAPRTEAIFRVLRDSPQRDTGDGYVDSGKARMRHAGKIKVALMSYAMDGRVAKGSIISTPRLIERLVRDPHLDVTLIHFDASEDPLYREAREIIMPALPFFLNRRFFRMLDFFC